MDRTIYKKKRIKIILLISLVLASFPAAFVVLFHENQTLWWTLIGVFSFLSCVVFCGLYEQTSFDSIPKFIFILSGKKIIVSAIPVVLLSILLGFPFLYIMILDKNIASVGSALALVSFLISSFKMFNFKIITK